MKFDVLYNVEYSRVILMAEGLGFGAKLTLEVYNEDSYEIAYNDFDQSEFELLFYPSFLIKKINEKDSINLLIENHIHKIRTGSDYNEFILKMKSLFSYFNHNPESDYSNHSDYHTTLGDSIFSGNVEMIEMISDNDKYEVNVSYTMASNEIIEFKIICFYVDSVGSCIKDYEKIFPPHLLMKRGMNNNPEIFIKKVLSKIKYSSKEELLLKLATFSFEIHYDSILPVAITKGLEKSYSIKSYGTF